MKCKGSADGSRVVKEVSQFRKIAEWVDMWINMKKKN